MSSSPSEHIYRQYEADLANLKERLLAMGGLAEEHLRRAVEALVARDRELAQSVIKGDEPVNAFHKDIDDRCFKLMALRQPLAVDLRTILAVVKINTDLERVGDLAVNIAEAALRYLDHVPVKELIDIPRMGEIAQTMLRDALDAYVRRDVELAQSVLDCDDRLDELKNRVFRELLTYMMQNPAKARAVARTDAHVAAPGTGRRITPRTSPRTSSSWSSRATCATALRRPADGTPGRGLPRGRCCPDSGMRLLPPVVKATARGRG